MGLLCLILLQTLLENQHNWILHHPSLFNDNNDTNGADNEKMFAITILFHLSTKVDIFLLCHVRIIGKPFLSGVQLG